MIQIEKELILDQLLEKNTLGLKGVCEDRRLLYWGGIQELFLVWFSHHLYFYLLFDKFVCDFVIHPPQLWERVVHHISIRYSVI